MSERKILIDLDGVLNEYNNEKFKTNYIPKIKKGAREFILEVAKIGKLYLFTCRNLKYATKWLIENKLDEYFEDVTNVKIPSYLYIDDRCICFKGNYTKTLKAIGKFEVYWKNKKTP